jgi:hypothetical protein
MRAEAPTRFIYFVFMRLACLPYGIPMVLTSNSTWRSCKLPDAQTFWCSHESHCQNSPLTKRQTPIFGCDLMRSLAFAGRRICQTWHCGKILPRCTLNFLMERVAMSAFYLVQFHIGQLVSDMVLNLNDPDAVNPRVAETVHRKAAHERASGAGGPVGCPSDRRVSSEDRVGDQRRPKS